MQFTTRLLDGRVATVLEAARIPGYDFQFTPWSAIYVDKLVAAGWSCFPQTSDHSRMPASIYGSAIEWGVYQRRLPDRDEIRWWANKCPHASAAIVLGSVSHNSFVIDVDCLSPATAALVRALIEKHLGAIVLERRTNDRCPKFMVIMRAPAGATVAYDCVKLPPAPDDHNWPVDNAVEILGAGRAVTAFGWHHRRGSLFIWPQGEPWQIDPATIPEVSADQLESFVDALRAEFGVATKPRAIAPIERGAYDESLKLVIPGGVQQADGYSVGALDAAGLLHDGRKRFRASRSWAYCRANPTMLNVEMGRERIAEALYAELLRLFADPPGDLLSQCVDQVARDAAKVLRPGHFSSYVREDDGLVSTTVRTAVDVDIVDKDLSFLPPAEKRLRLNVTERTKADPIRAVERSVIVDPDIRTDAMNSVSTAVRSYARKFVESIWTDGGDRTVHVLKAPPGAGKTRAVGNILQETKAKYGSRGGPVLMSVPTLANAAETEAAAEKAAAEYAEQGLRTLVYKGKIEAGCFYPEKLKMAQGLGVGSAMCKWRGKDSFGETIEKFCDRYDDCPAIAQRRLIESSDLIILATAYLTVTIPKELQKLAKALIIDETCAQQLLRSVTFPLSIFDIGRSPPRPPKRMLRPTMTKNQKESISVGLMQDRDDAAKVAKAALLAGKCPAAALFAYRDGERKGADLIESAITVCSAVSGVIATINPDTDPDELQALVKAPKGSFLFEERRFWKICKDRIDSLSLDDEGRKAVEAGFLAPEAFTPRAKGSRDYRIQLLDPQDYVAGAQHATGGYHGPTVRLSWRSDANFAHLPTLLLDASANDRVIAKLFPRRKIEVETITSSLHLRTVAIIDKTNSTKSLLPSQSQDMQGKISAAKNLVQVRKAITAVATLYSRGRVVANSAKPVREAINTAWRAPDNVDFVHNGAMRGRDAFANHVAAISIGRNELSARAVDAIVAALTYDDDEPEDPIDALGTGLTRDGRHLWPTRATKTLKLRDGSDLAYEVPVWTCPWARIVQEQTREEELIQFYGRLRPVYNPQEIPPAWFAGSSVIPDGVIIDAVIAMADLAECRGPVFEAMRRAGGVLDPALTAGAVRDIERVEIERGMKDVAESGLDCRLGRGLTEATLQVHGEDAPRGLYVASWQTNPAAAIREAARKSGLFVESVTIGRSGAERVEPNGERGEDAVEAALGSLDERWYREEMLRDGVKADGKVEIEKLRAVTNPRAMAVWRAGRVPSDAGPAPEPVEVDIRMILTTQS